MRLIIPALCATFVVAGCQTVDDTIQKGLPATCALIASGHEAFLTFNANHPLKPNLVQDEAIAFAASVPICADPTKVTTANALVIAANVWAAISKALREVDKVEASLEVVAP